jgi:hypothetical protein
MKTNPARLLAVFFLTALALAFAVSPVRATITITATPFYVAYNNGTAPSASLYNQITGGANGIEGMYIAMTWDCFVEDVGYYGGTLGYPIEIEGETKDEAIRSFLTQIWGELEYGSSELEQLRGWLKTSIGQSVSEDGWITGFPVAYTLDTDEIYETDYDDNGNATVTYYGTSIFGLYGYIVTASGTEPVIPTAPVFSGPGYGEEGEVYIYVPGTESVIYSVDTGGEYFWTDGTTIFTVTAEPAAGYYFPAGTTAEWTYPCVPASSVQIVFEQLSPVVFTGQTVTGGGWAVDDNEGAPVERVEVWVDGNYQCDASLDIERPDVADDTGRYDWTYSGFGFSFSTTGLSVGQHTVEVIAYNSQENAASASLAFTVVPTIPIPTGIGGMTFGTGGAMLSWNLNSGSGVTYELERKTGNGNFIKIADLAEGVYSFTDSGLSPGTTYTYRLRAKTASGYSGYSDEITITTDPVASSLVIRTVDGQYWEMETATWEITPVSNP